MKKKSYNNLTIKSITDKAGVSRQSFYRNYREKDEIIIKFFDEVFNEFSLKVNKTSSEDLKSVYLIAYELLYKHKDALVTIHNASLDYLIYKILLGYNTHFQNNAKIYGLSNNIDISPFNKYWVQYHLGGGLAVTMEWIREGMYVKPEVIGNIIYMLSQNLIEGDMNLASLAKKYNEK